MYTHYNKSKILSFHSRRPNCFKFQVQRYMHITNNTTALGVLGPLWLDILQQFQFKCVSEADMKWDWSKYMTGSKCPPFKYSWLCLRSLLITKVIYVVFIYLQGKIVKKLKVLLIVNLIPNMYYNSKVWLQIQKKRNTEHTIKCDCE